MESPFGRADSPLSLRGVAGPSRAHKEARQLRNTTLKPYDRRSIIAEGGGTGRPESLLSSSAMSMRSAKSKTGRDSVKRGGGAGVGLLSGLRQAIFSRPFSWLQGASATKETSSSSSTLPSYAAPMMSAAQKLAASVKASSRLEDIETLAEGTTGRTIAPPTPNTNLPSQLPPFTYTPARSPSPARSSASAAIQSHGRQRLSVGPGLQSPKYGGSTLGTPGYIRSGSLRPDGSSVGGLGASQSSPAFAFGFGSERRIAGVSSAVGAQSHLPISPLASSTSYTPLASRSPFAMKRQSLAESSAGGTSILGYYDRSPRAGNFQSITTPSRSRPTNVFGGDYSRSRAGSVADSRMSTSSQTPKRREWSSLKMAPPRADMSAGEELMQAYVAMRNGANTSDASAPHPLLQNSANLSGPGSDILMMDSGAGSSSLQRHFELYDETPLKRGVSMSIDGDEAMNEMGPRKRQKQMVWDSELGFVSKEDLKASRPTKPVAQNEAERLLNALEGLRAPAAGLSAKSDPRRGTPLRQMMPVSVPLPVPERSEVSVRHKKVEDLTKTVSPYSRAMRSKMSQSVEPEEGQGLRSRLRKPVETGSKFGKKNKAVEREKSFDESMDGRNSDEEKASLASEGEREDKEEEEEDDDDDIVEPPRRKPVMTSRSEKDSEQRILRSGKVLPPSPAKKSTISDLSPFKLGSTSSSSTRPMSKARLDISANGASAISRQKASQQPTQSTTAPSLNTVASVRSEGGQFQVRSDAAMERSRSSLRQGAEKTHRSHGKSGRVGLDDDDDDEVDDLPTAEELNKIKLPINLFPQGFTFSASASASPFQGGASSSSSSSTSSGVSSGLALKPLPALSDDVEIHGTEDTVKEQIKDVAAAGGSLLNRMGGFAAIPQSNENTAKQPTSSFSFIATPPAVIEQSAPASKPIFSFQSSEKTSASDFFRLPASTPKESSTLASESSSQRKDGSIPNFFASSLAKADTKKDSNATPPATSFSFTKPADEVQAPEVKAASIAATPSFSSGASSSSMPLASSNMFSAPSSQPVTFGNASESNSKALSFSFTAESTNKESPVTTFQGFGKSAESSKDSNLTRPAFGGFGVKPIAESTLPSTPSFSFQATSATPASTPSLSHSPPVGTSRKREAEEQDGGPSKKSNGFTPPVSFGFNGSASKSDGFSFGAPKSDKDIASSTGGFGTPLQFKSQTGNGDTKAVGSSTAGTSGFGGANKAEMMDTSPSSAQNGAQTSTNLFAVSSPTPAASKPTFSFNAPSTSSASSSALPAASQGGFSFSIPSTNKSNSTPAAAPSFGFNASSQPSSSTGSGSLFGQPSAAPSTNMFGAATSSKAPSTIAFGSGGFGSSNNDVAADNSRQGSPAPFAFGAATSTQPAPTSGFGGGFTPQLMSGQTAPTPAFSFNSPSAAAPTTPGGGTNNNSGFSFNMSNANGSSFGMPSPNQSAPFVFGTSATGTSTPPPSQAGSGFNFNMGSSAPQSPIGGGGGGGGNLFNMGSAPAPGSGGGNRPMRSMPARRKR